MITKMHGTKLELISVEIKNIYFAEQRGESCYDSCGCCGWTFVDVA